MNVLAINCGSSTLKFQLLDVDTERRLAYGVVDRIGGEAEVDFQVEGGAALREAAVVADHDEATRRAIGWLEGVGFGRRSVDAVGHRVVHGGGRFVEPTIMDDAVVDAIQGLGELAPLHNAPALSSIWAARAVLGAAVPMVATFDTAFHRTLSQRASQYAIPPELAARHRIRRYGFHGLAHRYMAERYAEITSTSFEETKLITLQLGAGCSATAVDGGLSVDTSMGYTPLEGLMMATRSGDLDPSLAGFLARREDVPVGEVEDWLNTRSGLLGVSGRSGDMRELLAAEAAGDERAALAVEIFCYRVRKYIGSYLAVLGGADAVVFGGGIGENAPAVRSRICDDMGWCGLNLDEDRNTAAVGSEARISSQKASLHAYVIPVDEGVVIVRDTVSCLRRRGRT